ncbi:MAG: transaldolase family protein [Chloroflexota bacterium]|jgi:transaldolase
MSKLHEAAGMGQSIWLNSIDRPFIHSQRLHHLIRLGVHGITSHPGSIANALADNSDYDHQLMGLVREGKNIKEIAEKLLFTDIQTAVDLIHPIYERTHGVDGYVSLDVNPALEDDVDEMVSEGLRLVYDVDRVNAMIQIPATPIGIQAIKKLVGEGVNVNATHIYTVDTYEKVAQAYIAGVDYFWSHLDIWRLPPAAVATLPVTRLDQAVDARLNEDDSLRGTAGIAEAKVIYGRFQDIFSSKEWKQLSKRGSRLQRPLWASSDNPRYVLSLMGPNTVHSLPPAHITAYLEDSPMTDTLTSGRAAAQQILADVAAQGIDLPAIGAQLQADAVKDIRLSYHSLAETVIQRRDELANAF